MRALLATLVEKCASGRFILTVICGIVFAYVACKGQMEISAIVAILTSVFKDYFGRSDRPMPEVKPGE